MRKLIILILNVFIIFSANCIEIMEVNSSVLWDKGEILLELTFEVTGAVTPKTRFEIEQYAEDRIPQVFMDEIMGFNVDSYSTVYDLIFDDYSLLLSLNEFSETGRKGPSFYNTDFSGVTISYSYPLFGDNGIIRLFINHDMALPLSRVLGFSPTEPFTGIVIYAKGEFKTTGPSEPSKIEPALFPKIYDEDLNVVLEKEMCYPQTLKEWGMTAYSTELNLKAYEYRIGDNPIKIMARMVYGINRTDIVISNLNATQILSLEVNRELLRNGNILIIYDEF